MLALDGALPREALAVRLWPDIDVPSASRNLRRGLFRLRGLGVALDEAGDGALALGAAVRSDVHRFHAALDADHEALALAPVDPQQAAVEPKNRSVGFWPGASGRKGVIEHPILLEDLEGVQAFAQAQRLTLPLAAQVAELHRSFVDAGIGAEDTVALMKPLSG